MDGGTIRKTVRERYAGIARRESSCCGSAATCGGTGAAEEVSRRIGYSEREMGSVPEGANLGLGCGNPTALASIRRGETVLDLGSGAGFDCFLAAKEVGPEGRVIGVDMTPEMVEKAQSNAEGLNISNVEFRLGEIEKIPVEDDSVDVAISNCVINLSPDKNSVFREIHRTLRPGGRIIISDILRSGEIPKEIMDNPDAYTG